MSIKECILHDFWKMAIVVPVYKKGDTSDMSNYRPVSLLSLIGKVLEKIICRQVNDYIEEHSIFSPTRNGFCRWLAFETAMTRLTNLLFSACRNILYIAVVTIDFTKAFDVINFNHLLNALSSAGFGTDAIAWFGSYLHDRTQRTKYFSALSPLLSIPSGVPQYSVIGSVLYNIFANCVHYRRTAAF